MTIRRIYPYDNWPEEGGVLVIMPLHFYVTAPQGKLTALLKRAKYVSLYILCGELPSAPQHNSGYVQHKHLINAVSAVISGQ